MKVIRKKLAINDLPCIDYYNKDGHWKASIYEMNAGWWSVRLNRVALLGCYHSEEEAYDALSFWLDIPEIYIKE